MTPSRIGLYIHIPFCVKKCNYCAFLSFDAETSPRKEYTDALVNEIRLRAEQLGHPHLDTVYVGGGTPSVLDISQMRDIMHSVSECFRVREDAEITIEANPATLGRKDGVMLAKLQAYRYMGFNRLSMGVQSMDNDRLHFMGRIHTAENVARDMELARKKGFDNINLDLIFSVPGSSTEDAIRDLEKILSFEPEHISCYSLQIEEGTPFGQMAATGELREVPDEEDRQTYHEIIRILRNAGYEHYEISNFARMDKSGPAPGFISLTDRTALCGSDSGLHSDPASDTGMHADPASDAASKSPYRSRHNSLYWDMSDYIGCGLGASGFVNGVRYKNITDIENYIGAFGSRLSASSARSSSASSARSPHDPDSSPRVSASCSHSAVADTAGDDPAAVSKTAGIPLSEEHINTAFDNISEAVFTGLRRREGITYKEAMEAYMRAENSSKDCTERSAETTICDSDRSVLMNISDSYRNGFLKVYKDAASEIEKYEKQGLLLSDDNGIRLTEQGIDISNQIMSLFV